jgi:YggT family protein
MSMLASYGAFVAGVRVVLLYAAIVAAVVCAIDWAVRTRRINPFSRVARFCRSWIDPLVAPAERVVLRTGGNPSSAAWWMLAAVIVCGILLIGLLQLAGGVLQQIMFGIQDPGQLPKVIVSWIFSILRIALVVRVLSSWLPVPPRSKWIRWSFVLTDWMVIPLGRIVPRIGMFDITPIVAWILLDILQSVLGIP